VTVVSLIPEFEAVWCRIESAGSSTKLFTA
jgi:hypothetical protein